jgi:hypothetical protein
MATGKTKQTMRAMNVLADLSPRQQAVWLRRFGDPDYAAQIVERGQPSPLEGIFGFGKKQAWENTTHQVGFITLRPAGSPAPLDIVSSGLIDPDPELKKGRINIHLDRLRAFKYPGSGKHEVLFKFEARNQLPEAAEPITFSQAYSVQDGQLAGVQGYPIFIGLSVGPVGASFRFETINVQSGSDEAILQVLQSSEFKAGLNLLKTAQPALVPFTALAQGVAENFLKRNRGVRVQSYHLGLDFTTAALGASLRQGNYLVVQVPDENTLKWSEWVYNPEIGAIVSKADEKATIPYNYVSFRVTRYEE